MKLIDSFIYSPSLSIMDCLPACVSVLKLSLSQTLSAFLCRSWTVYLPVSQFSSCHCLRLSVPFSVHHGLSACLGLTLSSQAVTVSDTQCLSLSIMDCLPACVSALKLSLSQTLSAFLCPSWTVCLPGSQLSSCHCLRLSVPFSVSLSGEGYVLLCYA